MDRKTGKDDVGHLIRDAGAREAVSAERFAAARARVAHHWRGVVDEQRKPRPAYSIWYVSTAAAVAVAALVLQLLPPSQVPVSHVPAATVNRIIGDVKVNDARVVLGTTITSGSTIDTGADGMLALDLTSGQSLRVGSNSLISATAGNHFSLLNGRVYVDSGPGSAGTPVFIETPFGTATDVGTQFQVLVDPESLKIGVREGLVELNRKDGAATTISLGTLLTVSAGQQAIVETITADDAIWEWTAAIAPNFETDGATLSDYLAWYTRQAGVELRWLDAKSKMYADQTTMDGSIDGLSLEDGLQAVHKIAPFEYQLLNGVMTVKVR